MAGEAEVASVQRGTETPRNKRKRREETSGKRTCSNCGQKGHDKRTCPAKTAHVSPSLLQENASSRAQTDGLRKVETPEAQGGYCSDEPLSKLPKHDVDFQRTKKMAEAGTSGGGHGPVLKVLGLPPANEETSRGAKVFDKGPVSIAEAEAGRAKTEARKEEVAVEGARVELNLQSLQEEGNAPELAEAAMAEEREKQRAPEANLANNEAQLKAEAVNLAELEANVKGSEGQLKGRQAAAEAKEEDLKSELSAAKAKVRELEEMLKKGITKAQAHEEPQSVEGKPEEEPAMSAATPTSSSALKVTDGIAEQHGDMLKIQGRGVESQHEPAEVQEEGSLSPSLSEDKKAPSNVMQMFKDHDIELPEDYEGRDKEALRDYGFLLPETDPAAAEKEALEALSEAKQKMIRASDDLETLMKTRCIKEGYTRYLEEQPSDLHVPFKDEKDFNRRMISWARQIPTIVRMFLKAPKESQYLKTTFMMDSIGINICCAGHH